MGTDIHAIFQRKIEGGWADVKSDYDEDRHYGLFAHLAGIRNGRGFAGVITGQPVTPISEPRGLPDDFPVDHYFNHMVGKDIASHDDGECWMGEHSHSWLTADEILAHQFGGEWKSGIITVGSLAIWGGVSAPESYCGGISGQGVIVAETPCDITKDCTHVRVFWRQPAEQFGYFINEVKRLQLEHGEVRMVFGFDS